MLKPSIRINCMKKICILTSHNPRHIYVANQLSKIADYSLVISSAMGLNPATSYYKNSYSTVMEEYFNQRFLSELSFFNDRSFNLNNQSVIVVGENEINNEYVYEQVKDFKPDLIIVFGTNILKGKILSITSKIINMHLGMSPYFNGSNTNFWPMYQKKYEYVGVTIHYIDAGVDTGNILHQTRALIEKGDSPHSIGNKNIILGVNSLKNIIPEILKNDYSGIKQWPVNFEYIPKMKDFNNQVQLNFTQRIKNDEINIWLKNSSIDEFNMVRFLEKPTITNSSLFKPEKINI